ncbi:MAG: hypothetical protein AAFW97_12930 [Pseudomonadota bacterium]
MTDKTVKPVETTKTPPAAGPKTGTIDKIGDSAKVVVGKFSDGAKGAAGKVGEGAKTASGKIGDGAKKAVETVKTHPGKTAAVVGGVAAAAAGAVVGKKYYDKRKAAKDNVEAIDTPEMRAGDTPSDEPKVAPTAN